jgi:hypothetical protein
MGWRVNAGRPGADVIVGSGLDATPWRSMQQHQVWRCFIERPRGVGSLRMGYRVYTASMVPLTGKIKDP